MSPEALDALRDVIQAATKFVQVIGVAWFVVLVVFVVVAVIGWRIYQDNKESKSRNAIVEEKEKEIVRLSEVNRELRTQLLRLKGFPENLLKADAEDSGRVKSKGGSK